MRRWARRAMSTTASRNATAESVADPSVDNGWSAIKPVLPLVIVALSVALVLATLGWWASGRDGRPIRSVVVAKRHIRPLAVVSKEDVTKVRMRVASDAKGIERRRDKVVGKAVIVGVDADDAIRASMLVPAQSLANRVQLTLSTAVSADGPKRGQLANVFVSPRVPGSADGVVLPDVLVLAVTRGKPTIYRLAVSEADRQRLVALLGFSDVQVVRVRP